MDLPGRVADGEILQRQVCKKIDQQKDQGTPFFLEA
jgi:hypothetical protein